jgi:hypothetical protein
VVLHYLSIDIAAGSTLIVGSNKKISLADQGSEFAWLPAVNKWALFFNDGPRTSIRCWVTR